MTTLKQSDVSQEGRKQKVLSLVLASVVALAVLVVSFLPLEDKRKLHSGGRLHSWGHLMVFTVVGFVASKAAHSLPGRIAAFGLAIGFGFAIEMGEHLAYGNGIEWKDVLVDALGVAAGTLISVVSTPRRLVSAPE